VIALAKILFIRCSDETFRKFRLYTVQNDFKNYEQALNFLLEKALELDLKPVKGKAF
jgi:hypothetical protein